MPITPYDTDAVLRKEKELSNATITMSNVIRGLITPGSFDTYRPQIRPAFVRSLSDCVDRSHSITKEVELKQPEDKKHLPPLTENRLGVQIGNQFYTSYGKLQAAINLCDEHGDIYSNAIGISKDQLRQMRAAMVYISRGVTSGLNHLATEKIKDILSTSNSDRQKDKVREVLGGDSSLFGIELEVINYLNVLLVEREIQSDLPSKVPEPRPASTPTPPPHPKESSRPVPVWPPRRQPDTSYAPVSPSSEIVLRRETHSGITGIFLVDYQSLPDKPKFEKTDIPNYIALAAFNNMCTTSERANIFREVSPNSGKLRDSAGPMLTHDIRTSDSGRDIPPFTPRIALYHFHYRNNEYADDWSVASKYGNTPGEAARTLLKYGKVTLLNDGKNAFICIGQTDRGNLIVWDPVFGENERCLREVDSNSRNLRFFMSASLNPLFGQRLTHPDVHRSESLPVTKSNNQPTGKEIRFGQAKEYEDIRGQFLVRRDLLPGAVQEAGDSDSCVYFSLAALIHLCGSRSSNLLQDSESLLSSSQQLRKLRTVIRRDYFNNQSRLSDKEAINYLNSTHPIERAKSRSQMAYDGETVGQTVKRILKDGYTTMMYTGGHAVLAIGEANNGNIIVWDPKFGEAKHGLREIDARSDKLEFNMAAKINPYFRSK